MTSEQKSRALACIEQAEEIGEGRMFKGGKPCCSVGWLLHCAGINEDKYDNERVMHSFNTILPRRHPEFQSLYGISNEAQLIDITSTNDLSSPRTRRAAVLALISSWEVEDGPS